MHVKRSQLIPGCILLKDVAGKTKHPIIPKDTVLTEKHLLFLEKFLIEEVHVYNRLANGNVFLPSKVIEVPKEDVLENKEEPVELELTFIDQYMDVVTRYKKMYNKWKNNFTIDIPSVRELVLPLYNRADEVGIQVYLLYKHANKEDYIYHHHISVGILAAYLAKKMGYTQGESLQIGLAGLLSDSGMVKVDNRILRAAQSLTLEEWKEVKKHPADSYYLVKDVTTLTNAVKTSILQHHERMDGSGYPLGLTGAKIHPYARILAVCDKYHAMTCERLYKDKLSPFKALEIIRDNQFTRLDPEIVQSFIRSFANVLIGIRVELSNGKIGKIIFIDNIKTIARPVIKMEQSNKIISLNKERTIHINEILYD